MQPETAASVYDMVQAAKRIAQAASGHEYSSFVENWILVSAVERQFGIIGEALVRVRDRDPGVFERIPDASKIVGLRNLIVHGYDAIDPKVLWAIIEDKMPVLILTLEALQLSGSE